MPKDFDCRKIAMYPIIPEGSEAVQRPTDFDFIGHATRQDVPSGMTFVDFLELEIFDGTVMFGKRREEEWVTVIPDPLAGELCTLGRVPEYEMDIVP